MAGPLFLDRVMETSTTTGTGTYTLAGAVTGFQTFAAVGDGNTCYYSAAAVDANGIPTGDWEVGLGTFTSSGTTLARTTILASTNANAAVNWAAGTKRISVVLPASLMPGGTGGPVSTTVLTTGTAQTYTVPTGIRRIKVHVQGPGGGGGGSDQSAAGCGCGGGGGAGGYAWKVYSVTPGQTFTYTVGLKGAGGLAGNNAGSNGTANSVFDSGGTPVTGALGTGGGSMAVGTSLAAANAGTGGAATGGDVNIAGQSGGTGYRFANANLIGGIGASSTIGAGGFTIHGTTSSAATGYGAGGAGSMEFANQTDRAGGDGANGVIIIEEYDTNELERGTTVQVARTQVTASTTGTGTIPIDNTKPQNTEGNEFMTLAITPKHADHLLKIDVVCFVVNSVINQWMMVALFQDSTADALATQLMWQPAVNSGCPICFTYYMAAGTTSATTFKVRAGANLAGTTYFNRLSSGDFMGGTITSSITITEIDPTATWTPTTTQFVRKVADETVNNSSTIQADDELIIPIRANETWEFEFNVIYTTTAAADFKAGLKFPTSPTQISYTIVAPNLDATFNSASSTVAASMILLHGTADAVGGITLGGDTSPCLAVLRGFVRNGANAGNIVLWWAQGATTVTDTIVKAGSWASARRVA